MVRKAVPAASQTFEEIVSTDSHSTIPDDNSHHLPLRVQCANATRRTEVSFDRSGWLGSPHA